MPSYRLQAITRTTDGLSANYATNTWYVTADDEAAASVAADALGAEYVNFSVVQSNALVLATNGLQIKCYNMADPEPRALLFTNQYTLFPSGGDPLPTECAICLSYSADPISGVPISRLRGRVYLPFLMEGNNGADGRPNSGLLNAVESFGQNFLDAGVGALTWVWVQHSVVNDNFNIVMRGFVDNEWDTQRRRGRRRTARQTFAWDE